MISRFFIAIIAAFTLYSCTDDIDLDLPDPEPVLAIDGKLSQDSLSIIRLSEIQNYLTDDTPDFTQHKNASIQLFEDSILVGTYQFNDTKSYFEINHPAIPQHSYYITLTLDNGDTYVSVPEWIKQVAPIDSIWFDVESSSFNSEEEGDDIIVKIDTYEPAGLGDHYQWKVFINDEYQGEPFDLSFSDDKFVDGQFVSEFEVFSMTEKDYETYKKESPTGQVIIRVQQHWTTKNYYNFLFEVFQQTAVVGSPFSAPPAEIRGNVQRQNDPLTLALGYFTVSNYDEKSIEITLP